MPSVIDQFVEKNVGPYQILRPLGRSTLSAVYEVRQDSTMQTFILTTFIIPETFSPQARQHFLSRFARESAVLMRLSHPYILPVQAVGEYVGNPYLVNPIVKGSSLTKLLKQKGRFTPEQTLELLKRLADSIDYAHSNGVVHGTLSPVNILLSNTLQIAGFGIMHMLTMRGIENGIQQTASRSIAGTTLGTLGYIAPEVVQGKSFDGRIDVYALGILLLELLSGSSPFNGANIAATQYVQAPRLSVLCPDLPASLDAVIQHALEPDPAQRIQSAGALATSFLQALTNKQGTAFHPTTTQNASSNPQVTLPGTIEWFTKEEASTAKWQLVPPVTAQTVAIRPTSAQNTFHTETTLSNNTTSTDDASIDPFVWWASMTAAQVAAQAPGTFTKTTQRLPTSKKRVAARKQDRRRVVAMLAGGGVVALGALGFGGMTLAHVLQNKQTATTSTLQQPISTTAPTTAPTQPITGGTQVKPTPPVKPTQPHPTVQSTPTTQPTAQPTPTTQPTAQPTQPPVPTPTQPPQHTGTVIGSTGMSINASKKFTNPTNGTDSILVHLPNGNFVAYNKACTHEGVAVYYDSGSQQLKCPAHGAVFDPANGGSPVQGPVQSPLQSVPIRVNGDGTITTG